MFWMKVHRTDEGKLLAACDADILGNTYTDDSKKLDIAKDFYGGEKVDLLAILDELEDAATTNFVGHDLLDELLEADIIQDEEIEEIGGMVHTHMYFI